MERMVKNGIEVAQIILADGRKISLRQTGKTYPPLPPLDERKKRNIMKVFAGE